MKNTKLIYLLAILLCTMFLVSCQNDGTSIKDKIEQQKAKTMFPFSDAKKIEVFSYKSKDETDNSFSLLLRDQLNNPARLKEVLKTNKLNIKERIVLPKEQIQELSKILYAEECGDEILGNCSTARHAILFYDKDDTPIAMTEISLDCFTATFSKNFTKFSMCETKIQKLVTFFKKVGITYFEEPVL